MTHDPVVRYHDGTKHHFHRFAPALGYLDWASQPHPFRSFDGAPIIPLPAGGPASTVPVTYDRLFEPHVEHPDEGPRSSGAGDSPPISLATIGDLLRHALGLSAWKQFRESRPSTHSVRRELVERRWSLRVNPSSGNLHPTEAYVIAGAGIGLSDTAGVYHYAPDRHVLEMRCAFGADDWRAACGDPGGTCLVALTSIHWREAWKYGERAFRYCQHDLGHAIAALRLAAALAGWKATLQPAWSHRAIAALIGVDRDADYVDAEREEPACVLSIVVGHRSRYAPGQDAAGDNVGHRFSGAAAAALADAAARGRWRGRASQLSEDHVEWTFIDEVARTTEDLGRAGHSPVLAAPHIIVHGAGDPTPGAVARRVAARNGSRLLAREDATPSSPDAATLLPDRDLDARALMLQRRSALAFDGRSSIDLSRFVRMMSRVMPAPHAPWDALWWGARIHLLLFVHRVDGLEPGLYLLPRDPAVIDRLRAACGRALLWEPVPDGGVPDLAIPLVCLARGDCRRVSQRLSCDQEIAADGFFSLGMIADFDASLAQEGPSFYRHLFWESGVVGQVLYLEAEAAGARATGIGCFYDDPVHDILGLTGHAFQSLYHFTVGVPVEDTRLTTEPGYPSAVR